MSKNKTMRHMIRTSSTSLPRLQIQSWKQVVPSMIPNLQDQMPTISWSNLRRIDNRAGMSLSMTQRSWKITSPSLLMLPHSKLRASSRSLKMSEPRSGHIKIQCWTLTKPTRSSSSTSPTTLTLRLSFGKNTHQIPRGSAEMNDYFFLVLIMTIYVIILFDIL